MKKIFFLFLVTLSIGYSQYAQKDTLDYEVPEINRILEGSDNILSNGASIPDVYNKTQIDAMITNLQSQINELNERLGNLNPVTPKPVTNLIVNTIYNDSIKYSFTNPASNFDSIQFWGRNSIQGGLQFIRVGKVDSGRTTWTWRNLTPNNTYELYAIAYDGITPSLSSNIVDATTSYTSIYYLSVVSPYNFGIIDSTTGGSSGSWGTIWNATEQTGDVTWSNLSSDPNQNWRAIIKGTSITSNVTAIKVVYKGSTADNGEISASSIGLRSGTTSSFSGSPTAITFSGGATGVLPQNGTLTSDSIAFTMNAGTTYLLHTYVDAGQDALGGSLTGSSTNEYFGNSITGNQTASTTFDGWTSNNVDFISHILGYTAGSGGNADTTLPILITNNNDVSIDISGITGTSSPFTVESYPATISARETDTIFITIDRNKTAGIYSNTLTITTEFATQTLGILVTIQGVTNGSGNNETENTFDYYVSANGTGNGLSPSTPMSFASFLSTNLVAGDTVGFKNGDLFRLTGYYTINDNNVCLTNWKASGTTDTRPRFYKSTDVLGTSGWTNTGTNRWSRTVSVATTGTQLFFRNADHTSKRGYKQTNATDVDVPYEWHTTGTVLTVYSPTATNPTVYYENIERIANNEYRGFTISATGVTLDSLEICYGYSDQIEITNGNGRNTVKYCEIHNAGMGSEDGGDGIYCKSTYNYFGYNKIYENAVHNIYCQSYSGGNSGYNTIEFNEVFNTYHTNIDIMNDAVGKTNNGNQVRYNIVYDNANKWNPTFESIGIQVQGYLGTGTAWCYGNKVYGNLIYGQRGISINIQSYADSVYIYNNTIHYSTIQTAIVVEEAASVSPKANAWISNNLCVSMTGSNWFGLFVSSGTNKHISNNGFYDSNGGNIAQVNGTNYTTLSAWQSAGWGTGDVWANPLFTDYANNDFTLQTGSPMKNTGATLGGAYNNSLNGVTRPIGAGWDIGAYEQ